MIVRIKGIFFYLLLILSACTIKRQKEAVATYLGHDINGIYGRGGTDTWEYSINGKTYRDGAWNGQIVGAKYIVIYDSLNPYKNNILSERPVFAKDEKTDTTIGIITSADFAGRKKWLGITYKYQVKGIWYEYSQYKKCAISDTILPKINDRYKVAYWIINPHRAIFQFDKPLSQ